MEPECLPFVKVVRLNNNNFENIPKWFLTFRCTNLEEFNYSCNKANHYKYLKNSFCLNLIKLKKLELRNSCLIDRDYDFLKCFKSISYLDISNEGLTTRNCLNKFHELDELFVKPKWKELHILRLESLSISLFPEGIAWIETLRELYLTNNNLSWLLDDIQFLVNLEVLDISNNSIVAIPSTLVSLVNLTVLRASDNSIESVFDFSLMHNLKTLDLYNNLLDTIAFSMDTIDFVDLEGNYYDTKHFENYSAYEEKKNFLRNRYSYQRYDGPKTVLETFTSSSSDSDEDAYYERSLKIDCTSSNLISIDETENWDLPVKSKMKNPEIDSVDDDWQGEDKKFYLKGYSKKDRVYVSDDDWMFIDFEES
ncbi:hypothetical protein NQ314_020015 [Rhamnusium bicolor]|uniref:Uncharacterized protein n=1 Tax=Rhamnusium bicolor TaxID=1586634 RepID=A0AAV8WLV9_9CUCU|nr:hypothetical protein NQ314_020015 [Rhamnusium bicolor]